MGEQSRVRVLVVDDDPGIYQVLRTIADHHPTVEVIAQATTPEQAVAISRADPPDAILLDHQFPTVGRRTPHDGVGPGSGRSRSALDAVEVLRSVAPDAVIAVYTGTSGLGDSVEHSGADLYFLKGHDPHAVLDEVAERARRRGQV